MVGSTWIRADFARHLLFSWLRSLGSYLILIILPKNPYLFIDDLCKPTQWRLSCSRCISANSTVDSSFECHWQPRNVPYFASSWQKKVHRVGKSRLSIEKNWTRSKKISCNLNVFELNTILHPFIDIKLVKKDFTIFFVRLLAVLLS